MVESKNLPLFMGISEKSDETIETLLKGNLSLEESLVRLSRDFKIRVQFSEPVTIQIKRHWVVIEKTDEFTRKKRIYDKTANTHVFSQFVVIGGRLHYTTTRNARYAYPCPWLDKIVSYEPVDDIKRADFKDFEQFKKKFDPLFITDTEIQKLWNQKSSQHGGRYKPSDFHRLGLRGHEVLKRFLIDFNGVPNPEGGSGYRESGIKDETPRYYLTKYHDSWHHSGRDIKISHLAGNDFVWYSSEYHGCGNGRYGLLANKNEFLWLEDD